VRYDIYMYLYIYDIRRQRVDLESLRKITKTVIMTAGSSFEPVSS
jgi:hypothetical protein